MAEGGSGIRARIAAWIRDQGVSALPLLSLMPSSVSLHRAEDATVWLRPPSRRAAGVGRIMRRWGSDRPAAPPAQGLPGGPQTPPAEDQLEAWYECWQLEAPGVLAAQAELSGVSRRRVGPPERTPARPAWQRVKAIVRPSGRRGGIGVAAR